METKFPSNMIELTKLEHTPDVPYKVYVRAVIEITGTYGSPR